MTDLVRSHPPPVVKLVGANGQLSLGKQFAGRQVLVEEQGPCNMAQVFAAISLYDS